MRNNRLRFWIIAGLCVSLGSVFRLACAQADSTQRIAVVVFDDFFTSDVIGPLEVFGNAIARDLLAGYEVVTVAPQAGAVTAREGITVVVDYELADLPDVDVLIVGSRMDMSALLADEEFMGFIAEQGSRAKWIASNCSGAFVLARAGLLDGKKATTYLGGEEELQAEYPLVRVQTDVPYVVDGNVVTSNGSLMSYPAALELLRLIAGEAVAEEVAEAISYTRLLERGDAGRGGVATRGATID